MYLKWNLTNELILGTLAKFDVKNQGEIDITDSNTFIRYLLDGLN